MPTSQKLALNCNSRWRYKRSKFEIIPYKPFKICFSSFSLEPTQNNFESVLIIREIYMGQYNTFIRYFYSWELQLRGKFWQGPFFKDALFENGAKSHNFTNLILCDITL